MIFVTAGTQEPFDRLIQIIDELAFDLKGINFVVQALHSDYKPRNIEVLNFISVAEFDAHVNAAQLIISHAGIGTIISALEKGKPIIVMPRLMKYNEHRNEHQLATAKKMEELGYVNVAYDGHELKKIFKTAWPNDLKVYHSIGKNASSELLKSITDFIKF